MKHTCETLRETNDKILMNFLKVLEYIKNNDEAPDNQLIKSVADIDIDLLYYTQSSCKYFKIKDIINFIEEEASTNIDLDEKMQNLYEYYLNKREIILTYLFEDLFELYSNSFTLSQTFSSLLTYLKTLLERENTFFLTHFVLVPKKYTEFVFKIEGSVLDYLQNLIYSEKSFEEI